MPLLSADFELSFDHYEGLQQLTTVMLNENSQAGWSGLFHYYHFAAENIVTGIASLALSGFAGVPEQLLIPWDTEWHDRFGMNEMVVKGVWGEDLDRVVTPNRWDKFGGHGESWIFFERSKSPLRF